MVRPDRIIQNMTVSCACVLACRCMKCVQAQQTVMFFCLRACVLAGVLEYGLTAPPSGTGGAAARRGERSQRRAVPVW